MSHVRKKTRPSGVEERLTHARWSEEVDDETLSLALDEVIEANLLVMSFDEGLKKSLAAGRNDEVSKRFIVPLHVLDPLDVEFH